MLGHHDSFMNSTDVDYEWMVYIIKLPGIQKKSCLSKQKLFSRFVLLLGYNDNKSFC